MHKEVAIALELHNQILPPTPNPCHSLPLEGSCHSVGRLRASQARIEDHDPFEPPAGQERIETRANRLDLGKLWHTPSLASPSGPNRRSWLTIEGAGVVDPCLRAAGRIQDIPAVRRTTAQCRLLVDTLSLSP